MDYGEKLADFDASVCEALAVSQGCAGRFPLPYVAYGSHLFARLCAHGTAMVRAAPRSRWVTSDHEDWNFCCVASHARAILEGYMFFAYLTQEPSSEAEWVARVNLMHLNDCTRRVELMTKVGSTEAVEGLSAQQEELRERLRSNDYFKGLPPKAQKECLKGEKPWFKTREQMIDLIGMKKADFDAIWLLYSQHAHILPLSFYRIEVNGRGTGLENETDRQYITASLQLAAEILRLASDRMVMLFPDLSTLRKGLASKFSPGPAANSHVQKYVATSLQEDWLGLEKSKLSRVIGSLLGVAKQK